MYKDILTHKVARTSNKIMNIIFKETWFKRVTTTLLGMRFIGPQEEAEMEFDIAEILPKKFSWGKSRKTKCLSFGKNIQSIMHFANIFAPGFFCNLTVVLICMFPVSIIQKSSKCCFIRVSPKLWCPRSLGTLFYVLVFFWTRKLCFAKSKWNLSLKRFEFCLKCSTHKFSTSLQLDKIHALTFPQTKSLLVLF